MNMTKAQRDQLTCPSSDLKSDMEPEFKVRPLDSKACALLYPTTKAFESGRR